jgi:hypothetical protein
MDGMHHSFSMHSARLYPSKLASRPTAIETPTSLFLHRWCSTALGLQRAHHSDERRPQDVVAKFSENSGATLLVQLCNAVFYRLLYAHMYSTTMTSRVSQGT